jgi:hypothetical protein
LLGEFVRLTGCHRKSAIRLPVAKPPRGMPLMQQQMPFIIRWSAFGITDEIAENLPG